MHMNMDMDMPGLIASPSWREERRPCETLIFLRYSGSVWLRGQTRITTLVRVRGEKSEIFSPHLKIYSWLSLWQQLQLCWGPRTKNFDEPRYINDVKEIRVVRTNKKWQLSIIRQKYVLIPQIVVWPFGFLTLKRFRNRNEKDFSNYNYS